MVVNSNDRKTMDEVCKFIIYLGEKKKHGLRNRTNKNPNFRN